ncbi:hypothetical protein [Candidatus Pyrohabitans sp.]
MGVEEEVRNRLCRRCDFYREGETLECAAFKVAKRLVEQGRLGLEEL